MSRWESRSGHATIRPSCRGSCGATKSSQRFERKGDFELSAFVADSTHGPWTKSRVREFLAEARMPMRLAANTDSGFPIVLSLWFLPEEDELLAAVHRDARIVKRLRADPRCAFEIAPNEPPYRGVRGQAIASLDPNRASALLERLLGRYLGSSDSSLGRFLLARADEELIVRLQPSWIASWDYSRRMEDALQR